MSVAAVLLCAGRGERLGLGDKALVPLAERALWTWSLAALAGVPAIETIVVVGAVKKLQPTLAAAGVAATQALAWCEGGRERQDSVAAGLRALPEAVTHVAVHDSARPLVTPELIARVIADALQHGAAIAALPVDDTLKRATLTTVDATVPRAQLWRAQTPQVFRRDWLEAAHAQASGRATDDAALVEALGKPVHLTHGDPMNFKVTTPRDLELAEAWLARPARVSVATRVGIGYDVHRLIAGRPLVLGGVTLESARGLDGHSDADVLLHAIADALLGALGLGDIGTHFPPGDARWKDASSLDLLRAVRGLVAERGGRIVNVDSTVVAEAPRIAPHRDAMCAAIGAALGLEADRVSVKATTNEGLGTIGRGEGIAAWAVAAVEVAG